MPLGHQIYVTISNITTNMTVIMRCKGLYALMQLPNSDTVLRNGLAYCTPFPGNLEPAT